MRNSPCHIDMSYFEKNKFVPNNILDIGCNTGQFYRLCRDTWGRDVHITVIDGNLKLENQIKNLRASDYKMALLSDSKKEVIFYNTKKGGLETGASIYRENTEYYNSENAIPSKRKTTTLSEIFGKKSQFDLIKLDVQGSEIDIMKGGYSICKRAKYIIVERSLGEYNFGAPLADKLNEFMNEMGYDEVEVVCRHCKPHLKHAYKNDGLIQEDVIFKNREDV